MPAALRGFAELRFGEAYFLFTTAAAEWSPPAAAVAPATTLVELDAGVNHVAYFGEPRDVTEAVASIGEALSGVWQFHGPTQSWRLWSSSLPAALRGFDTFADGSAYFFILDAPRPGRSATHPSGWRWRTISSSSSSPRRTSAAAI